MAKKSNGHASIVIVLMPGPDGIIGCPIVKDYGHAKPLWKFPGGKGDDNIQSDGSGENGAQTASRELEEETGISIPYTEFQTKNIIGDIRVKETPVYRIDYGPDGKQIKILIRTDNHEFFPYYALLPNFFENLKEEGDEGEKVAFVHIQDILNNPEEFLQDHYRLLMELLELREYEISEFFSKLGFDLSVKHPEDCPYKTVMQK